MNCGVYIIASINDETWCQYPDDYTRDIFLRACKIGTYRQRIVYVRNGNMMYHLFFREIDSSKTIGLCFAVNSAVFVDVPKLQTIFAETFARMVWKGTVVSLSKEGKLAFTDNFSIAILKDIEYERTSDFLTCELKREKTHFEKLPSENFSEDANTIHQFTIQNFSQDELIDALRNKNIVFVPVPAEKIEDGLERQMQELSSLSAENSKYKKEIDRLDTEIKATKLSNTFVTILIVIAGATAIFLSILVANSYSSQNELKDSMEHEKQYKELSKTYENLEEQYKELSERHEKLNNVAQKLNNGSPISITEIGIENIYENGTIKTNRHNKIHSSETMFLRPVIDYYGFHNLTRKIFVRFIDSNGKVIRGDSSPSKYSYSNEIAIQKGMIYNERLVGWGNKQKGNWKSGIYKVEIWYEGKLLKTKEFTIY